MGWRKLLSFAAMLAFTIAGLLSLAAAIPSQRAGDIEGAVTGPNGPGAGVWVIAETRVLATKFAKIVVAYVRGRYLIAELPAPTCDDWVRGYGLVGSRRVTTNPGVTIDLHATRAPDARADA